MNIIKHLCNKIQKRIDSVGYARKIGVQFGKGCKFISTNFGTEPYLIKMGDHVEITNDVYFITHDGAVWIFRDKFPDIDVFGPIIIGSNVFIGMGAIILPGVTIGDNCVIGAGAVVTRDIPSGSVAAGVPAKVIKTTDQYYESVKDTATHIRNLPLNEKRKILEHKFGLE